MPGHATKCDPVAPNPADFDAAGAIRQPLIRGVAGSDGGGIVVAAMEHSLYPREHGAYAQLGFPLLSGLALGSPGAASWLFAAAAVLLFFANEPAAVLLGVRGARRQAELAALAKRALARRAVCGALAGFGALWLASPEARSLALIPAVLATGLLPIVIAKRLKTLPGEFIAAAALASMHLPVAAAGGVAGALLWTPAAMWLVVTIVTTLSVHAIKARLTGTRPWAGAAADWTARIAVLAALCAGAFAPDLRPAAMAALLPLVAVLGVNWLAPSTKRLRQVGWTMVAANALALALLSALS